MKTKILADFQICISVPLSNSEIIYLKKFPSYVTLFFYFHFFIVKFPGYEKFAMASQFDLTRFYDIIISNSAF